MSTRYSFNGRKLTGARALSGAITKAIEKKTRAMEIIAAVDAAERMKAGTPVKSGRARSHWSIASGGNHPAYDPTRKGDYPVDVSGLNLSSNQPITIMNSAPYFVELEYGSSDQAPYGVMRLVVSMSSDIFANAARKVRSV